MNLLIKNKDSKPRKTCIASVGDRIVISAVKKYLYDIYYDQCFNISANNIIREIVKIINNKEKIYYKKIDLSSFFDNINHEILLEKISKEVDNNVIIDLVKKILENPQKCDETDRKIKNELGVPQGISIATLLANIYMHDFDLKYNNYKNITYFRYVDDIIIFTENKEDAEEVYMKMKYDLERKNLLMINQAKTEEGKIDDGLEYLGYRFEKDLITIRKSSIIKLERNLEQVFKNFSLIRDKNENQIRKFIWMLNVKITGILVDQKKYGWLYYYSCINDITLLKKLDLLIEKFIRRFKFDKYIKIGDIKKFTKAYFEINKKNMNKSTYLLNLNNAQREDKIKFLKEVCLLQNVENLSEYELDHRYRYNLYRTLKNLEKDIDSISG